MLMVPPLRAGHDAAGPRDLPRSSARSSSGCCSCPGASLRWLVAIGRWRAGVRSRSPGRTSCGTTRRSGSLSFLNPTADTAGLRLPAATSPRSRSAPAGCSARASRTARQSRGEFLPGPGDATSCSRVLAEELGFIGAVVVFLLFAAADLADARRAAGARATRSGRCSARASPRCCCSSSFVNVGHGPRDHARSRASRCPFITPRRGIAGEHRDRPRDHPERQHPPATRGVVTLPVR